MFISFPLFNQFLAFLRVLGAEIIKFGGIFLEIVEFETRIGSFLLCDAVQLPVSVDPDGMSGKDPTPGSRPDGRGRPVGRGPA